MKKFFSTILVCMMFVTLLPTSIFAADGVVEITTAEEFASIVNNLDGNYKLMNDITFNSVIGMKAEGGVDESKIFTGTLDGNGKTITINLTDVNHRTGIFAQAGSDHCVIKNLTVNGTITSAGNSCGGVVGTAKGNITFENVTSNINISAPNSDSEGSSGNGGILGVNEGNDITFKNCTSNATVSGKRGIGGFIGLVRNSSSSAVFEGCTFNGSVTNVSEWSDKRAAGGFIGIIHHQTGDEVAVTFTDCASNGSIEAYSTLASAWVGSYARFGHPDQKPVFNNCTQTAKVVISDYELSLVCETKYPEAHDSQCSGNVSFDADAKTVTGWTNFALNGETATAMAAAEGTKVYVNGVLDETAVITADGRQLKIVCSDPTVAEGVRTSILVVWADGSFTTLGQNHTTADFVSFTKNGANADAKDVTKNLAYVPCTHENTELVGATDSYTGDLVCTDCGETVKTGETIEPETNAPETNVPKTGDAVLAISALALVAAAATVAVARRRKNED